MLIFATMYENNAKWSQNGRKISSILVVFSIKSATILCLKTLVQMKIYCLIKPTTTTIYQERKQGGVIGGKFNYNKNKNPCNSCELQGFIIVISS